MASQNARPAITSRAIFSSLVELRARDTLQLRAKFEPV